MRGIALAPLILALSLPLLADLGIAEVSFVDNWVCSLVAVWLDGRRREVLGANSKSLFYWLSKPSHFTKKCFILG